MYYILLYKVTIMAQCGIVILFDKYLFEIKFSLEINKWDIMFALLSVFS